MADSLRNVIEDYRTPLINASLSFGLDLIPNELLVRIFTFAYDSDPERLVHVQLSHVCRRFRSVVLGTRTFWNYLSNAGSVEWTNASPSERRRASNNTSNMRIVAGSISVGKFAAASTSWRSLSSIATGGHLFSAHTRPFLSTSIPKPTCGL